MKALVLAPACLLRGIGYVLATIGMACVSVGEWARDKVRRNG